MLGGLKMAECTALARYYKTLGIPSRFSAARYFSTLRRFLRCPYCHQDAHIIQPCNGVALFVCDSCHRGWPLVELLYPDYTTSAPASTSGPASGCQPTRRVTPLTQLGSGSIPQDVPPGCVNSNSFTGELICLIL
jgi:hypothetical protein